MSFMKTLRKSLSRKERPANIQGAVFAQQAPVGVRKENGVFLEVRRGIAKSGPRVKSKKQLRQERHAKYFARLQRKQYEGVA